MCNNFKRKKNQRRIQEVLIRGVQNLVQKGLLNFFVANYFSQRRPRGSQSVNAGRSPLAREILLCEQRRTDHRRVSVVNCNNVVSCNTCRKL